MDRLTLTTTCADTKKHAKSIPKQITVVVMKAKMNLVLENDYADGRIRNDDHVDPDERDDDTPADGRPPLNDAPSRSPD